MATSRAPPPYRPFFHDSSSLQFPPSFRRPRPKMSNTATRFLAPAVVEVITPALSPWFLFYSVAYHRPPRLLFPLETVDHTVIFPSPEFEWATLSFPTDVGLVLTYDASHTVTASLTSVPLSFFFRSSVFPHCRIRPLLSVLVCPVFVLFPTPYSLPFLCPKS